MKHSPGLPQDTKSLRSFSGNWAKMLFKSHPGIKCHSQYIKVIRLLSIVPPIVNGGDWGCIVRDLETIIVLVLLALNFIPQRLHHSLTLPRSRFRDCYCNSDTQRWHNSHQRRVIGITDQLILQNGKKAPRGGTMMDPKHCPEALLIPP